MQKIVGFDTETYLAKEGKFLTYKFYSAQFFNPELEDFEFITDPFEVNNFFRHDSRGSILLANNAEYDFTVLAKILDKEYFTMKCLYNGSRFLYGKIIRGEHTWTIYDLMNIFTNWSLKKIGELIQVPKLDSPDYLGKRKPQTPQEMIYFRKYACRDAEIGYYAGIWLLKKFGRLSLSLPSMSFKYFNIKYKPQGLYLETDSDLEHKLRLSYKGGRCESWIRGRPQQTIYAYDKVSLYPSVMYKYPFPRGINGLKLKKDVNLKYNGFANCVINQDAEIPFLCIKMLCKDGFIKLVFPNGTFEGWFTYPELKYFERKKLGKILEVKEAWESQGSRFYFKDYVDEFFQLKKTDIDHSSFWKLCMNSLYGKFAQDANSPELQLTPDNEIIKVEDTKTRKKNLQRNVLVASYITAYARIDMYDDYLDVGAENLVYTDTDSIHSFKPISKIGKELGDMDFKLEGKGTYIRSKFYLFNDIVRCRGMERIFSVQHLEKMIERNDCSIMRKMLLRLRSAYRRHTPFITETAQIKSFSLKPDCKRIYLKSLIGKELLNDYTLSKAVFLNGSS